MSPIQKVFGDSEFEGTKLFPIGPSGFFLAFVLLFFSGIVYFMSQTRQDRMWQDIVRLDGVIDIMKARAGAKQYIQHICPKNDSAPAPNFKFFSSE